jgi:hypothetical protein
MMDADLPAVTKLVMPAALQSTIAWLQHRQRM